MKTFNTSLIISDSLRAVVETLDAKSRTEYTNAMNGTTKTQCLAIGAHSALLEVLAEKLGGLWLFGARFVEDAAAVRDFCQVLVNRAEDLAKVAEVESIDIVTNELASVEHWLNRGAQDAQNEATASKYGVHVHTVEVLRDIETLTEEEARETYTAEELAQAQALAERETAGSIAQLEEERAEVADLLALSERSAARIAKRLEDTKAEALAASACGDREAWAVLDDKAVKLSAELDTLRALAEGDRVELEAIDNRLSMLRAMVANRPQLNEPQGEDENDNEQGDAMTAEDVELFAAQVSTPNAFVSACNVLAVRARQMFAKVVHACGRFALKVAGLASMACVCALALVVLFGSALLFSEAIDCTGIEMPNICRGLLHCAFLLSIALDLGCWAGLQLMAVLERLGAFAGLDGFYYRGSMSGVLVPYRSIIGALIFNLRTF